MDIFILVLMILLVIILVLIILPYFAKTALSLLALAWLYTNRA